MGGTSGKLYPAISFSPLYALKKNLGLNIFMLQLCHKYDVANYDWLKKEVGLCKSNVQLQFVNNCGKLCS